MKQYVFRTELTRFLYGYENYIFFSQKVFYKSKTCVFLNQVAGVYGAFGAISMVLISELCVHVAKSKKSESNFNKFMQNIIHGFLFYSLGAISTMLITEIGKHTVGRLRPHFITVCQPDWDSITCFSEIQGVKVAE
jgi:hypothetical protein